MFGLHDYRRCYVLPDDVAANIPRRGCPDEPGSFDYARGVLVEISQRLDARAVCLHYRELELGVARLPVGIEITATVRRETAKLVTSVSRHESAPYGARGDCWQLTVDGAVPDGGIASYPPSLPWMADLVGRTVDP